MSMHRCPLGSAPALTTSKPFDGTVPGVWWTSSPCLNIGFRQNSGQCFICRLPFDLLVDNILAYLSVADIIHLRCTNTGFFILTHESVIWKRFLGYLQKPVPLFHDERFSFSPRDLEPERVLAQMSSTDDNWVSSFTRVFHANTIFLNRRVYDMKLLPGGKYLVVAAEGAAHVIAVFELCGDHPDRMTFRLVSSTNIPHRAFQLQTRFMPFQGDPCVFIGYVYRRHGLGSRNNSVDLSEIDYFYTPAHSSVQYIWRWSYIKLDQLKVTENQPPLQLTWKDWYTARDAPIYEIGFFAMDDVALVGFIQGPNTAVFIPLQAEGKPLINATLCQNPDRRLDIRGLHIRALRVLPRQGQFLVIQTSPDNHHYAQVYSFAHGKQTKPPDQTRCLEICGYIPSFQISDNHVSTEYLRGHANYIPNEDYDPPPISIFVQTSDPPGLVHYMMMPIITPYTKSIAYTVEGNAFTQQSRNNKGEYHVLPGIHRALVYKTVHDNTTQTRGILELRRYMSKQRPHPAYVPPFRVQPRQPLLRRYATDSTWKPIPAYSSITLPNEILQRICTVGLDAITWEEGTGRICISSRDGKVVVLDIGKCTPMKETISILDQKAINIHLDANIGR